MRRLINLVLLIGLITASSVSYAKEVSFTQEDRDRLIRLEVTMKEFKESVDKRFEQVDKRFEQVDRQLDRMSAIFTALVVAVIGFAYWDRRTIIRKAKEETIAEIEKEGRLKDMIAALRDLSKTDEQVARVLKQFNLL